MTRGYQDLAMLAIQCINVWEQDPNDYGLRSPSYSQNALVIGALEPAKMGS